MRRRLLAVWCLVGMTFGGLVAGCAEADLPPQDKTVAADAMDGQAVRQWMATLLEQIEAQELAPPQAARVLGYASVAMHESVVSGVEGGQSLGGQLNELGPLPELRGAWEYDYPTVLHGAMGYLLPLLMDAPESEPLFAAVAAEAIDARRDDGVPAPMIRHSRNRGILIAEIIAAWADQDGYHTRHDLAPDYPTFAGAWEPTGDYEAPLEPNWSRLRPMVLPAAEVCQPPGPIDYSEAPDSAFYAQAHQVWSTSRQLRDEERTIARFWADAPGETATPAGHWMALANQLSAEKDLDLGATAALFALLGVAMADAVISCWDEKYRSHLLRPVTYIQRHIDSDWTPLIETPPFPEYTSGHSNFSGAAAAILSAVFGELSFEDRSHAHRGWGTRSFESFEEAAQEAAQSRLYGGIHYPMGIDAGVPQGYCVADHVLSTVQTGP